MTAPALSQHPAIAETCEAVARAGTVEELFGIVGDSPTGTLAPRIFNEGLRAIGRSALYVPFAAGEFAPFWEEVVLAGLPDLGLPVRGLTVKSPHKESALAVIGSRGERARRAGAANCVLRRGDEWHAVNTTGLIDRLTAAGVAPAGLTVAVVGCGGAGRAVAAGLDENGAAVTLVNRSAARGRYASELLGLPWVSLDAFRPRGLSLVVNATPLVGETAFRVADLDPGAVVADIAYVPDGATALVAAARERGLTTVDGREVLAAEMAAQFLLMTGEPLPADAARLALG